MKYLVIVLTIIIVVLVGVLAFVLGRSNISLTGKSSGNQPAASSPVSAENTQKASPTPTAIPTKKVTGGGILSFPKYELTIPADWENTRESSGENDERIVLKKGLYSISITQGGFGGAVCLYPGDPDIEGPSARYEAYKEITTKSGDLFRRSWTGNELSSSGYGICHKSQYGWGAPTNYGHISYTTPVSKTRGILDEMDTILTSITKI